MNSNIAIIESDSVIASMTRASFALAEAVSVSQTKTIIDVARAAEIYAKRQHLSESAISQATSVKVEAMRKLGEILMATPKAKGVRTVGGDSRSGGSISAPPENSAPTLEELGLTKKESAVAQQLANLTDEAFEQVREGSVTIAKALAAVKADKEKPAAVVPKLTPAQLDKSVARIEAERNKEIRQQIAELQTELTDEPDYTELDAAHDQIQDLQAALAVATMGEVSEEDKAQATTLISELRAHIKTITATLRTMTISRDALMDENAELKKQITRQRREIDKVTGKRTA